MARAAGYVRFWPKRPNWAGGVEWRAAISAPIRKRGEARGPWRWRLVYQARGEGQLSLLRRTLADCQRDSMPRLALFQAYFAGMLDFHHRDNRPARPTVYVNSITPRYVIVSSVEV